MQALVPVNGIGFTVMPRPKHNVPRSQGGAQDGSTLQQPGGDRQEQHRQGRLDGNQQDVNPQSDGADGQIAHGHGIVLGFIAMETHLLHNYI